MKKHTDDIVNEPALEYDGQYTYGDYLKFEYDHMVELIRGKIYRMTPAPASYHQDISGEIFTFFKIYLKGKTCKIYNAPFDVVLPVENQKKNTATTVVQPDICIICDLTKIDAAGCTGAPDLIVEILSPSTSNKDLNDKYSIYEESGVSEYWIVMPNEKLVEVFYLENGRYSRIKVYTQDEKISPILFPDLEIDLVEVFKEN
jgi:Uma2 family endonuclease